MHAHQCIWRCLGISILKGALRVYRCVEGACLANDDCPDLATIAGAGEVAEGALHLGEQAHASGAAMFKQSSAAFSLGHQHIMRGTA